MLIYIALIVLIVSIGVFYRVYPRMPNIPYHKTPLDGYRRYSPEGFANPAVAPQEPRCVQRSRDALAILKIIGPCRDQKNSPSEDDLDRQELALILQKLTCLDSDVNNNGVAGYNTLNLPYNTSHDLEPLTNFVGRCLNNGTRSRDLELIMDKYDVRGKTLIKQIMGRIGMDDKALQDNYQAVIRTTMKSLTDNCLAKQSNLDRPYGPRDPGYATPYSVERLASF